MPIQPIKECDICGYSYNPDNHEHCPKCLDNEDWASDENLDDDGMLTPEETPWRQHDYK